MAFAQKTGSNTLAMVEIAVIISASPRVSCFWASQALACPTGFRCRDHFRIGHRKNTFLAVRPGSLTR